MPPRPKKVDPGTGNLPPGWEAPDCYMELFTRAQTEEAIKSLTDPEDTTKLKLARATPKSKEGGKQDPKSTGRAKSAKGTEPISDPVDPYLEALGPDLLPSPSYKGVQDYEAITMGLEDKYQVEACRTYLFKYGYTIRPIEGDGNCLVESIICQLGLRTATEIKYYNQSYMRRAVVMHCIEHKEELFEWLRTEVRNNYGRGTREGPFSVQSYLQYMLTDRKWLDSIFIRLVSSMWGLRITVVQSVNCAELRFRHDKPLDEVDIVLLYNCNENCGHYNGVIRTDSRFLECTKLIKSPNFDDKVDKAERLVAEGKGPVGGKGAGKGTGRGAGKGRGKGNGGGDNGGGGPGGLAEGEVGVDKERLKQLEEQEKELARERERLKELEKMEKEFAAYKKKAEEQKKKGDKGYGGTKQVPVGSSSESEREMMDNPQVVKKGDKHCEICNITFFTPSALKRHVNKFHKNKYKFKCEQCSKGFMFKIGLKNHAMTHKQKEQRIPCAFPDCETTFSNKRALQIHCNEIHTATPNVRYECNMCHKKFKQKRYLDQHWPRCPQNQNKPKHFCEICGAGPYPAISRVMIHKKMEHQWV